MPPVHMLIWSTSAIHFYSSISKHFANFLASRPKKKHKLEVCLPDELEQKQQARKLQATLARNYDSLITDSLTGVKCRATSVAKNCSELFMTIGTGLDRAVPY